MELIFHLSEKSTRPLLLLDDIFAGCTALLDTGARISMWTKDRAVLEALPAAKLLKRDIGFSGFGGTTAGDLYEMDLVLGTVVYPKIKILYHHDDRIPGYFLFSASMFEGMVYTIDREQNRLILDTRNNQITQYQKEINESGMMSILMQ